MAKKDNSEKVKKSSAKIKQVKENKHRKIVVTSALPYANGSIHLGHLVEYIQTDIFVRFLKLIGKDAIYCCADDTHGTPIEIKAKQMGIKPEELIAKFWKEHTKDFADFHIKFDSYYSTNSPENRHYSEFIYNELKKKGLIYTKSMKLVYCNHCKRFLPDRFVRGTCPVCKADDQYGDVCEKCGSTHKTTDLLNPKCSVCGNKPVEKESTHYFFKLSECKDQLIKFLKEKNLQKEVVNFCMGWIEKLEDWCISRDGPYFGFEIPGSKEECGEVKYFYVWLDAPVGYIASTANYCKNIMNSKDRKGKTLSEKDYWMPKKPEYSEIIHIIGKDIIYFHYLFWPAMLGNAGIKQPDQIMTHGFLTVNKEKMSKSRGTFVTARHYLKYTDPQYLRFYYAANLTGKMEDIDLDIKDFKDRVNSELIGNIANFGYRTISFINKNFDNKIGEFDIEDKEVQRIINEFKEKALKIRKDYHDFEFREVVKDILYLSSLGNKYFQDNEPWKLVKGDAADQKKDAEMKKKAREVLSFSFHVLKNLSIIMSPILPRFSEELQQQLNLENGSKSSTSKLSWDDLHFDMKGHKINEGKIVVKKLENEMEKMIADNAEAVSASSSPATNSDSNTQSSDSNTQNAAKTESNAFNLDLRVAKVLDVKDHPSADRLFIFQCDLGKDSKGKEERRQIVAGLKKFMTKEDILGKNIILVTNLEPVVLKGERSEGMSLSAEFIKNVDGKKTEKVVLLHAPHSKPGDRVYVEGIKLPKEGTDDYKAYFKTIKFDDFLKYKFVVKNKEVLDTLRNNKHLKTDKEKIKAEIEDGAKVC